MIALERVQRRLIKMSVSIIRRGWIVWIWFPWNRGGLVDRGKEGYKNMKGKDWE